MAEQRPAYFYKYMSSKVAPLVLQNRRLRWSAPSLLNDPFDMQFDLHVEVDREKLRALTLQKQWDALYGPTYTPHPNSDRGKYINAVRSRVRKVSREDFDKNFHDMSDRSLDNLLAHLPQRHKDIRAGMETSRILCLSAVGDSLPMWSYYADNHRGAVLRFKQRTEVDSLYKLAQPITYTEQMPRLFDEDMLSDLGAGLAATEPQPLIERLVYTKAASWKHEQEWRLFLGQGYTPGQLTEDLPFFAIELDAVILGCAMTEGYRHAIRELTKLLYPDA